jgi:hypothetical protein
MFPFAHNLESETSVLTSLHLDSLGGQESKVSETYAEWSERPAKKSAVRFEGG